MKSVRVLSQKTYIEGLKLFEFSNKIPKIPMNSIVNLRVEEGNPDLPSLLPAPGTVLLFINFM